MILRLRYWDPGFWESWSWDSGYWDSDIWRKLSLTSNFSVFVLRIPTLSRWSPICVCPKKYKWTTVMPSQWVSFYFGHTLVGYQLSPWCSYTFLCTLTGDAFLKGHKCSKSAKNIKCKNHQKSFLKGSLLRVKIIQKLSFLKRSWVYKKSYKKGHFLKRMGVKIRQKGHFSKCHGCQNQQCQGLKSVKVMQPKRYFNVSWMSKNGGHFLKGPGCENQPKT